MNNLQEMYLKLQERDEKIAQLQKELATYQREYSKLENVYFDLLEKLDRVEVSNIIEEREGTTYSTYTEEQMEAYLDEMVQKRSKLD